MNPFTLVILDEGAQLWDGAGRVLASLPAAPAAWAPALASLPPRAPVQLLLGSAQVTVRCQDVPILSRREAREVVQRLGPPGCAHTLDRDPMAEGGHQLWLAGTPPEAMAAWLVPLAQASARPMFATPWPRAFQAAARHPAGGLYLAVQGPSARLLFFQGQGLRFQRAFPLAALSLELPRFLQFLHQKHRGLALAQLSLVGPPVPALAEAAEALGLTVHPLAPDLPAFLLAGAARERQRPQPLELLPLEVRQAHRRRLQRTAVWVAAAALLLLGAVARLWLLGSERALLQEVQRAEAARDQRLAVARSGEEAVRLRFALLRVRWAENRQVRATEHLEQLGLRLFKAPAGVVLHRVELTQAPGEAVGHRFTVEGSAITRASFSLGGLATYCDALAAHPGLRLDPLGEVSVLDHPAGTTRPEQALTRFRLGGSAP